MKRGKLCQELLPRSRIGKLDHVSDPFGHVCGVALDVSEPGVAHQGRQVRPLIRILPQADVHKVLHLR